MIACLAYYDGQLISCTTPTTKLTSKRPLLQRKRQHCHVQIIVGYSIGGMRKRISYVAMSTWLSANIASLSNTSVISANCSPRFRCCVLLFASSTVTGIDFTVRAGSPRSRRWACVFRLFRTSTWKSLHSMTAAAMLIHQPALSNKQVYYQLSELQCDIEQFCQQFRLAFFWLHQQLFKKARRDCYHVIVLYRDGWIAAIAWSGVRRNTHLVVMCTSQCKLRSLRANSGICNVICIVT